MWNVTRVGNEWQGFHLCRHLHLSFWFKQAFKSYILSWFQIILCFKRSKGQFFCLLFPWPSVTSDLSSSFWQKWLKCRNKKEEGKRRLTPRRKHVWTKAIITFQDHVWPWTLVWVRVWATITLLQPSIRGQLIKDERRRVRRGRRVSLQINLRTKQPSAVSAFISEPCHCHLCTHTPACLPSFS